MILGNYAQVNRNCGRDWGIAFSNPIAVMRPWNYPNSTVSDTTSVALQYSGFPHGYNKESSYSLPLKSGALASVNNVTGDGGVSSAAALAVKLAVAALSGSGGITGANLTRIVQLVAGLVGAGNISAAGLGAFLQAVASLSGSGTVSAATRSGLGALLAGLTGSGSAAGSTLGGAGELAADIVSTGSALTTANVGEAVWAALAAANNGAGTMGEKLNDAGSAANPWTEVIESGLTAAEVMRLILASAALKTDGPTPGTAGTVTIRDVADSKDRITATVDENGYRTSIVLDPS